MALFSRHKKSTDEFAADASATHADTTVDEAESVRDESNPVATAAAPTVGITVQAFRGVGAEAGPEVAAPDGEAPSGGDVERLPEASDAPPEPQDQSGAPPERRLPLASPLPPEQTETVAGMKDNVLLREALKEIEQSATGEQLLGVMRQALQGHLYIRVNGDARAQIADGKPLAVAVVRDGDRQFMLAFSSAGAVRDSVQRENNPVETSAVLQPVTAVLQQVVAGEFAGLIIDNASAPHRVVFPTELLQQTLQQTDPEMTVKTLLAGPREQDLSVKLGEALAKTRMWVAANDGDGSGQFGIAEAQTGDGKRFLQLFSHPLEVTALGRGDRPLPFAPEQLSALLAGHAEMAGVVLDPAGPTFIVERDALSPVLALAENADE